MPQAITNEDHSRAAHEASRLYLRRCGWLGASEIFQQAYLLTLEASQTYDAERGEPVPYLVNAARRGLARWVWEMSVPVSITSWACQHGHVARIAAIAFDVFEHAASADLEDQLTHTDWLTAVRSRLAELLDEEQAEIVKLLLGDTQTADVSKRLGLQAVQVHVATRRARRHIRKDKQLSKLWAER